MSEKLSDMPDGLRTRVLAAMAQQAGPRNPPQPPPKEWGGSTIRLTLPWPPSVNRYWRHAIVGRGNNQHVTVYISKPGQIYRQCVASLLMDIRGFPRHARLRVLVEAYVPDHRERDLDNLPKALFDALQHGGAYHKDAQIDEFTVRRQPAKPDGEVIVTIEEIPALDGQRRLL